MSWSAAHPLLQPIISSSSRPQLHAFVVAGRRHHARGRRLRQRGNQTFMGRNGHTLVLHHVPQLQRLQITGEQESELAQHQSGDPSDFRHNLELNDIRTSLFCIIKPATTN